MSVELVGSNLVIAARHFNPSIFSQLWLVRNGILGEPEFQAGCVFTDQVANIESGQFGLLVVPPQLQFVPKVAAEDEGKLVVTKVGKIVRTLPHTPYIAVGLNFFWHVEPEDGNVPALTRSLFFSPQHRICQLFGSDDARFGAYFSKDVLDCRLKLDVKPIRRQTGEESKEFVQFAFNFHLDLPQEGNQTVEAIERQLGIWDEARNEATKIVKQTIT